MKSKNSIIFLFLILGFALFFSWQKFYGFEIDFGNPDKTSEAPSVNLTSTPEEIATSTPFEMPKDEISRGNSAEKQLIFTFDCGSGTNSIAQILDTAKKHNVKLTFFATGKFAEKYPDTIKQIANNGHEIFNHTYSHPRLTEISDEEIKNELEKANEIISDLTGKTTRPFFRPPYGARNQHVLDIAKEIGFHSVYWTFDALDWMPDKTAEQVKSQIYSKVSLGAIILMHVGDNITGQILDEVFNKLENDEYKIINLTEGLK